MVRLRLVFVLTASASACAALATQACSSSDGAAPSPSSDASTSDAAPSPDGGDAAVPDAGCADPNARDASDAQLELPRPTGSYAVGTQSRLVVDTSRTDPQAPDPNANRALMVQLYYPTDRCAPGATAAMAPYMRRSEAQSMDHFADPDAGWGFPAIPAGWEDIVLAHQREGIPMSSDGVKFPVVLFSHGMGHPRATYAAFVEELVSQGFVIASISHTYDTAAVEFPDGHVTGLRENWMTWPPPNASALQWQTLYDQLDRHVGVWVDDSRFVLDQITTWAKNDPLVGGRLDLDHVGAFGHSFGGATASELCALDPRVKAGADIDGTLASPTCLPEEGGYAPCPTGGRTLATPFMLMTSTSRNIHSPHDPTIPNTYNRLTDAGYAVWINGSEHFDFWDMALVYARFGVALPSDSFGTIDRRRVLMIANAYTSAFFRKHLKGTSEPLLEGNSPYSEVVFEKK